MTRTSPINAKPGSIDAQWFLFWNWAWAATTIFVALLGLGLWNIQLHGSLLDFMQDDEQSRNQLAAVNAYGTGFTLASLPFAAAALSLFPIEQRRRSH